jgi:transcriptional regulator with XRE-family HTH domain
MKTNNTVEEINISIHNLLEEWNISDTHNDKIVTQIIGLQLKKIRLVNKLTQTRVAKAINVTFQQVQKYEKGSNLANPIRLLALTQYFNVTIDYWVKPILNRELLLIKKKRGINVYPIKQAYDMARQTNQSHE